MIASFTPFPFPPSGLSYVKASSLIFLKFLALFFCLLLLVCVWGGDIFFKFYFLEIEGSVSRWEYFALRLLLRMYVREVWV